jgi:hypothetical protein
MASTAFIEKGKKGKREKGKKGKRFSGLLEYCVHFLSFHLSFPVN